MNTTTTLIDNPTATTDGVTDSRRSLVRGGVIGGASALLGNAALFALGSIGEPGRVVIGADAAPKPLTLFEVAATTVIAIALGTLALWVTRWRRLSDRTWAIGVAVVAAASAVPLWGLEIDTSSQLVLTAMHLLTGVCCIAAHRRRA